MGYRVKEDLAGLVLVNLTVASVLRFLHLWDGEGKTVLTELVEDYMHELLWGC